MITIFATPRPFIDKFAVIQRNAIASWKALGRDVEIILMGQEDGTGEIAATLGLQHIPDVECNEYGTPLVSALFSAAERAAANEILAYVNADIILTGDFLEAVQRIRKRPFLMVGRDWGLKLEQPLDFSDESWKDAVVVAIERDRGDATQPRDGKRVAGSDERLRSVVTRLAARRTGADYFAFSRQTWANIPEFAIGRTVWANWLMFDAFRRRIPVIDASDADIIALHQNHDWSIHAGGEAWIFDGPEMRKNLELASEIGDVSGYHFRTWRLGKSGGPTRLLRRYPLLKRLQLLVDKYLIGRLVTRILSKVLYPEKILVSIGKGMYKPLVRKGPPR